MIALWLKGILQRRSGRLLGAVLGVALTVALIGALGTQIASSPGTMTQQALAGVGVDWQVLPTRSAKRVSRSFGNRSATKYNSKKRVWYADVAAFQSTQGGSVQTTGAGKAVGLELGYLGPFPAKCVGISANTAGRCCFSKPRPICTRQSAIPLRSAASDCRPPAYASTASSRVPDADTFFCRRVAQARRRRHRPTTS